MATPDALLTRSFELATESRAQGDHPFGALLVVDGTIVLEALNRVHTDRDITAHAELMLVRLLERSGQLDILGTGTVYASCEPCPMCVGAMFWAGARHVVYGLSAARLMEFAAGPVATPYGFTITAGDIGSQATPAMTFDGPQREDEAAIAHFGYWTD